MLFVKYFLMTVGLGLLVGAASILAYDLYQVFKTRGMRRKPRLSLATADTAPEPAVEDEATHPLRLTLSGQIAAIALFPLLLGMSIAVVPSGQAGVLISQFSGTLPGTLYPGVHWIAPLAERIQLFSVRDNVFTTSLVEDVKKKDETLRVQTKEGLSVGLAVAVRFRLDASRLPYIYNNLPQPVEQELVPPMVASVFRQTAPNYTVQELFAGRRDEIMRAVAGQIAKKLAADGVIVKEVMLRDIQLPSEYAKGMEGLLLKEQEDQRLSVELGVKQKMVKVAELEADAEKIRQIKEAEGEAEIRVLQAKAEADAMQHTLPLKEKQIQQTRLEAEARKESTVMNAEAMAQAKVIDSKAELERRKLMTVGDSDHIRNVAAAEVDRLRLESDLYKQNPLLIQKIVAEKLSDKVQIMMVPSDGKFFFANDVLKGTPAAATAATLTTNQ